MQYPVPIKPCRYALQRIVVFCWQSPEQPRCSGWQTLPPCHLLRRGQGSKRDHPTAPQFAPVAREAHPAAKHKHTYTHCTLARYLTGCMLTLVLGCRSGPWRVMKTCLVLAGALGGGTPSPCLAVSLRLLVVVLPLFFLCGGLLTVTVGGCSGLTAVGCSGLWSCMARPAGLTLVPGLQDNPGCFAGKME